MDLEVVMLSEISQTEKDNYHVNFHIHGIQKPKQTKQTHREKNGGSNGRVLWGQLKWVKGIERDKLWVIKKITSRRCNVQHKEYSQQLCNKFVWWQMLTGHCCNHFKNVYRYHITMMHTWKWYCMSMILQWKILIYKDNVRRMKAIINFKGEKWREIYLLKGENKKTESHERKLQ